MGYNMSECKSADLNDMTIEDKDGVKKAIEKPSLALAQQLQGIVFLPRQVHSCIRRQSIETRDRIAAAELDEINRQEDDLEHAAAKSVGNTSQNNGKYKVNLKGKRKESAGEEMVASALRENNNENDDIKENLVSKKKA